MEPPVIIRSFGTAHTLNTALTSTQDKAQSLAHPWTTDDCFQSSLFLLIHQLLIRCLLQTNTDSPQENALRLSISAVPVHVKQCAAGSGDGVGGSGSGGRRQTNPGKPRRVERGQVSCDLFVRSGNKQISQAPPSRVQ